MTWIRDVLEASPTLRGAIVAVLAVMFLMVAREQAHRHVAGALEVQAAVHRSHQDFLRDRIADLEAELEECR